MAAQNFRVDQAMHNFELDRISVRCMWITEAKLNPMICTFDVPFSNTPIESLSPLLYKGIPIKFP